MDSKELGRRVRAARAYAGYGSRATLALELEEGLGASTLKKIEAGDRPVKERELREIAMACGLPYDFFTVDFKDLERIAPMFDRSQGISAGDDALEALRRAEREVAEAIRAIAGPDESEREAAERIAAEGREEAARAAEERQEAGHRDRAEERGTG